MLPKTVNEFLACGPCVALFCLAVLVLTLLYSFFAVHVTGPKIPKAADPTPSGDEICGRGETEGSSVVSSG